MASRFPEYLAFLEDATPGDMAYVVVCRWCHGKRLVTTTGLEGQETEAFLRALAPLLGHGHQLYRLAADYVRQQQWGWCACDARRRV